MNAEKRGIGKNDNSNYEDYQITFCINVFPYVRCIRGM